MIGGARRVDARHGLVRSVRWLAAAAALVGLCAAVPSGAAAGDRTEVGFLFAPTDAVLLPSGDLLVLEKAGILKLFPQMRNAPPQRVLDLRADVYDARDFGALALALSPTFATDRTVFVLYDRDARPEVGAASSEYGEGTQDDTCADIETVGCPVTATVVSFELAADGSAGPVHTVLANEAAGGWCFGFDGHGAGDLLVLPDGSLLVSAGDGATSTPGDLGAPDKGCGTFGDELDTEGGALRALDALTPSAYTFWNGAILRIDPATGAAWPDNPLVGTGATGDDRIVAIGMRNPFRLGLDAASGTVLFGDVGANAAEEIDRLPIAQLSAAVQTFEWPCKEAARTSLEDLLAARPLCTRPLPKGFVVGDLQFAYGGASGFPCVGEREAVVGGSVFGSGTSRRYLFGDWVRGCLVSVPLRADGTLDIGAMRRVSTGVSPGAIRASGDQLLLVDIAGNRVVRFDPPGGDRPGEVSPVRLVVLIALTVAIVGLLTFIVRRAVRRGARGRASSASSAAESSAAESSAVESSAAGQPGDGETTGS